MLHAVSLEFEPTISDRAELLGLIEREAAPFDNPART
jgi:hypothetical protein